MPARHERSIETAAAPQAVWRIWSDVSTWPNWNPNVEACHLDGPFATGTTGTMRNNPGGTHALQLANVEDGRAFTLETSVLPLSTFAFRCEIMPSGSGGAHIAQSVTMRGPLGGLLSALMGERIAASFTPLLEGLSGAAQQRST